MEVKELYTKIFNLYHKTRLTEDFHLTLTREETNFLLECLFRLKDLLEV